MSDQRTPLPRDRFPLTDHYRYLNHAGGAPLPLDAAAAMQEYTTEVVEHGSARWRRREARQEEVRATAAALLGVPPVDVAFVKNTTEGLGFVASGIEWREGDRVIVPDFEFPSALYPWLALRDRGVTVDVVQPVGPGRALPLETFADALTSRRARVVCVSWVQYGRGWRVDVAGLAKLCHANRALLCLDAIQGIGVLPCELDAWGVDFAMADGHKWMLGPEGLGVLYVRAERRDELRPLEAGWLSVAHRDDFDTLELVWDDSARRFEGGSPNFAGVYGLGASLDLITRTGVDAIWRHVDGLCDRLVAGLTDAGASVLSDRSPGARSAIVTFLPGDADPVDVVTDLKAQGFVCAARGGGVRVSPHGYNTADEIDSFVAAVHSRTSA